MKEEEGVRGGVRGEEDVRGRERCEGRGCEGRGRCEREKKV